MGYHERRGFQRVIKNDPYHIEERLQDYDPLLYVLYNPHTDEHLIMDEVTGTAVMKIPQVGFDQLDARVYWEIRRISPERGYSAIEEVEAKEARRQRDKDKRLEDMAYWMAKDLKKPLEEAFHYGRTSGVKKYA